MKIINFDKYTFTLSAETRKEKRACPLSPLVSSRVKNPSKGYLREFRTWDYLHSIRKYTMVRVSIWCSNRWDEYWCCISPRVTGPCQFNYEMLVVINNSTSSVSFGTWSTVLVVVVLTLASLYLLMWRRREGQKYIRDQFSIGFRGYTPCLLKIQGPAKKRSRRSKNGNRYTAVNCASSSGRIPSPHLNQFIFDYTIVYTLNVLILS